MRKHIGITTLLIIGVMIGGCGKVEEPESIATTVHNEGQSDQFSKAENTGEALKEQENTYITPEELQTKFEDIDRANNFSEGKSTEEMFHEKYGSEANETTTVQDIEVPEVTYADIDKEVYGKVQKEASAIKENHKYDSISLRLEEYNINGGYITYIAKCGDNKEYYHIEYNLNSGEMTTMPDESGYGNEIWMEAGEQGED